MDPTRPIPLKADAVIGGHRIVRKLGAGGFGSVYEAIDLNLDRPVALKVLDGFDAHATARFRDEARLLAQLDDAHIVRVYQVGSLESGQPFITMELFGRGSVASLHKAGHFTRPETIAKVIEQVLRGLAAAHERGVVHRDIKGPNLLVEPSTMQVKICDFGIARARQPLANEAAPTGAMVLGTPHYVAPERFRGVRDDPRSDLYSVGVVFYRLLSGRRPFDAPGADALSIAHRATTEAPPPIPKVHAGLARICLRLLERDPEARYQTALAAADDLARCFELAPTADLPPPAPPALEGPTASRSPWVVPLLVGSILVIGLAAWWLSREPARPAPTIAHPTVVRHIDASTGPIADASVQRLPSAAAPHDATVEPDAQTVDAAAVKALIKQPPKAKTPRSRRPVTRHSVTQPKVTRPQPRPAKPAAPSRHSRTPYSERARTTPFAPAVP